MLLAGLRGFLESSHRPGNSDAQFHYEGAPSAIAVVFRPDPAAVHFHQFFGDRQSQTRAALSLAVCGRGGVEGLEDLSQFLGGDARASGSGAVSGSIKSPRFGNGWRTIT